MTKPKSAIDRAIDATDRALGIAQELTEIVERKPYKLDSISAEESERQLRKYEHEANKNYTSAQLKARGLDQWRADPERVIADFNARLKMLEAAVAQLQLNRMQT